MKCTKCGAEDWTMVSQVGALETWQCNVLAVGRFKETELAPLRPKLETLGLEVEVASIR